MLDRHKTKRDKVRALIFTLADGVHHDRIATLLDLLETEAAYDAIEQCAAIVQDRADDARTAFSNPEHKYLVSEALKGAASALRWMEWEGFRSDAP